MNAGVIDQPSPTLPVAESFVADPELQQSERALIDAAAQVPVLVFYSTAIFWLLVSTALALLASFKIHYPDLLANFSFLTYGRVWPAHLNTFVYGWGCLSAFGTGIWLTTRLCRVALGRPLLLLWGVIFWNVGLALGVISIFAGDLRPFELLEFPGYAALMLFLGYSLIGIWAVIMFAHRRSGHIYISLWYLVGAFFWFPWLYAGANLMLSSRNLQGVLPAAIAAWYASNLTGLWFIAMGLAAVYYFIPKVIGRPIHSYYLAALGFWIFAVFYIWTGMQQMTGSPLPVWLATVSIAASIVMTIPLVTVTINYVMTMRGHFHMVFHSPTIRFIFFGAIAYSLFSLVAIVGSLRAVDRFTHFTQFVVAQQYLGLYAFFTMVMFGSIYYILPRLTKLEWVSASLIRIHFWSCAYGVGAMVVLLMIGGAAQGATMLEPDLPFSLVVERVLPYLRGRTLAWGMLALGHIIFALHFLFMLMRLGRPAGVPTLFAPLGEKAKS